MSVTRNEAPRPIQDRLPQGPLVRFIGVTIANALGKAGEVMLQFLNPDPNQAPQEVNHDR